MFSFVLTFRESPPLSEVSSITSHVVSAETADCAIQNVYVTVKYFINFWSPDHQRHPGPNDQTCFIPAPIFGFKYFPAIAFVWVVLKD